MSSLPYHKRYHSDALAGYMTLTLEERGAYTTLLDLMYDRGEPIIEHERLLAGYLGVGLRKCRAVISSLIEKGKIERLADGRLTNSRFEKEVEKQLKTRRKQSENAVNSQSKSPETEKNANKINDPPEPNPSLTRDYQKLEARNQKESKNHLSNTEVPSEGRSPPRSELERMEAELRSASGLQNCSRPNTLDLSPVLALVRAGVSFDAQIIPKARSLNGKLGSKGHAWRYLAAAVQGDLQADQDRATQASQLVQTSFDDSPARWRKRVAFAIDERRWPADEWGPPPGANGCKLPPELVSDELLATGFNKSEVE